VVAAAPWPRPRGGARRRILRQDHRERLRMNALDLGVRIGRWAVTTHTPPFSNSLRIASSANPAGMEVLEQTAIKFPGFSPFRRVGLLDRSVSERREPAYDCQLNVLDYSGFPRRLPAAKKLRPGFGRGQLADLCEAEGPLGCAETNASLRLASTVPAASLTGAAAAYRCARRRRKYAKLLRGSRGE
jgi:hypothetical protein